MDHHVYGARIAYTLDHKVILEHIVEASAGLIMDRIRVLVSEGIYGHWHLSVDGAWVSRGKFGVRRPSIRVWRFNPEPLVAF